MAQADGSARPDGSEGSGQAAWRLLLALQGELDLGNVLNVFFRELRPLMALEGLSYRVPGDGISHRLGCLARFRTHYRLAFGQETLGELTLARRTPFEAAELDLAESTLALLVGPLRSALRFQHALALSRRDPLTGLYNRAAMDEMLHQELGLYGRHRDPFSLLVLDLDDFKVVNDRYGHDGGDAVLVQVADSLRDCVREVDLVFRYAGDEFVIGLRHSGIDGARRLAQRITGRFERAGCNYEGRWIRVSLSIGCAAARKSDTARSLFVRADRALYRCKRRQGGESQRSGGDQFRGAESRTF